MRRCARDPGRSVALGLLATLLALGTASAQTGTVLSFQKQSNTQGQFTGTLDNFDEFGGDVVGLGDLDGPGPSTYALAVGTVGDDDGGLNRGAVYILFMGSAGNVLSSQKISSTTGGFAGPLLDGDDFGSSLAFLGDLDGPGPSVAALAVGAPFTDDGGTSRGAVWILFLNSNGTVNSSQKISNTVGGFTGALDNLDEFGGALAWLGDLDRSGKSVAALAVGAGGDDDGGADHGALYVLFLDKAGLVLSNQKISSLAGGFSAVLHLDDEFGTSLAGLGDLDGAGPSAGALAVGAPFDDDGGTDRGAIYVLYLASTGTVLSYSKISSTQGNAPATIDNLDEFGGALEYVGDMDGAGPAVASLAVGVSGDDDGGVDRGAVYLIHLASTGTVVSSSKISNTQGGFSATLDNLDSFGTSVAYLGDLDGAGPGGVALAVGTAGDDDGGSDRGAVYILFLSGTPTTDVPAIPATPAAGVLGSPQPNPFQLRTTIQFRMSAAADVGIEIRDVSGRLVRRFAGVHVEPGQHRVEWDARDDSGRALPPGTYFYRMMVNGRAEPTTEKAILLR